MFDGILPDYSGTLIIEKRDESLDKVNLKLSIYNFDV